MERKTNSLIKNFSIKLKKDFPKAKIYLIGSRTGKDYLINSDFDFIIVSTKFEKINFFKRTTKIYDYWDEKQSIDAFCYTPKEFKEKKQRIGFLQNAMQKAISI
jgi:uncharacterized protein